MKMYFGFEFFVFLLRFIIFEKNMKLLVNSEEHK